VLCLDGGERSGGPAAFGRFLDRRVDLAKSPVEVRDVVGRNLNSGPQALRLASRWQI